MAAQIQFWPFESSHVILFRHAFGDKIAMDPACCCGGACPELVCPSAATLDVSGSTDRNGCNECNEDLNGTFDLLDTACVIDTYFNDLGNPWNMMQFGILLPSDGCSGTSSDTTTYTVTVLCQYYEGESLPNLLHLSMGNMTYGEGVNYEYRFADGQILAGVIPLTFTGAQSITPPYSSVQNCWLDSDAFPIQDHLIVVPVLTITT